MGQYYGKDIINGKIDGEKLPRVSLADSPFESEIVLDGQPDNSSAKEGDVAFRKAFGITPEFFIFKDGQWVNEMYLDVSAVEQFRRNVERDTGERFKNGKWKFAYNTAIEPIGQNSLRYPNNVSTSENSDFVLFDFFDYQPPFKDNQQFSSTLPDELKAARQNGVNRKNADVRTFTNQTLAQYLRTGQSELLYKRDKSGTYPQIMLYMPDDISDTLKAEWEGKAFGTTAAGALSAAGTAGTLEKVKSVANVGKNAINRAQVEAAASLVTGLAKGITGDSISASDVFGGISGAIRNPNVEVLFQKMNLRTFDLTFKLIPYNSGEAGTIKKIINVFKKSMLPTYRLGENKVLGTRGNDNKAVEAAFIKVPKVCKVTYMRGSSQHPDLPTYKMCAVTDMNINYTPDGNYAVYNDGSPVAYEIKVSFMETKLLFADEIPEAWQGGPYGPMAGELNVFFNSSKYSLRRETYQVSFL